MMAHENYQEKYDNELRLHIDDHIKTYVEFTVILFMNMFMIGISTNIFKMCDVQAVDAAFYKCL